MTPERITKSRRASISQPPVEFVWGVPLQPFLWRSSKRGPEEKNTEPFLTTGQAGGSHWQKTYRLFEEHKGLFMVVASLKPTEDDIAAFANKYGSLFSMYDPEMQIWLPDGKE